MSLKRMKNTILTEAKEKEREITREAEKEAETKVQEARNRAKELEKKRLEEIEKEQEQLKNKRLAEAKLEVKNGLAQQKGDLIEQVEEAFEETIEQLDQQQERELIKQVLTTIAKESEIGLVEVNESNLEAIKSFISNEMDSSPAVKSKEIRGAIIHNETRDICHNYSFEAMAQLVEENNRKQVSQILFG